MILKSVHTESTTATRQVKRGTANHVCEPEVALDVHVLPLTAVLLKSLAFSRAAKPVVTCEPSDKQGHASQLTVFDKVLFVVDDSNVLPGQVENLAVLHFPQFICNLRNQTYRRSSSMKKKGGYDQTYGNHAIR